MKRLSFTYRFFGVFRAKSRYVQPRETDHDDDTTFHIPESWGARDWEDDGLDENHDRVFQAGVVPKLLPLNDSQKAILEDLPKISNPQPAIIFGNVEVKTSGVFEDGVNQACTSGAAMVEALRKLKVLADPPKPKAKGTTDMTNLSDDRAISDKMNVAFSMVLMPVVVRVYVHWVEISKLGGVTYHMHCIGGYSLHNLEAANNILDWGLSERNREIKGLLKKIHDREEEKAGKGKGKGKDKSVDEIDTESGSDNANGGGEKGARGD
ncbi:MAG: hypothetical protein Q9182_003598 [Xanthomendoza sp. 2 TL-2023]